jgi:DNA (cytosine-5)-methyltransferase 1
MNEPLFLVVDLFCGAGGTSTGFRMAQIEGQEIAKVIACVNHDAKAIKSHWLNHPEVKHFEEDIRTLDLTELIRLVDYYRNKYPNALLILWASLECTNFSKAKGGQPRDADSRTLADHLDRYVVALNPDYIQIENVVEFMSWGPLDEKGKPVSRKNGQDWMRWRNLICSHGYRDEWRELNSANYGAYTSRNRLFGVFAKPWLPIAFPEPTHAKNPSKLSMHGDLKKWMPVKEVLDFSDEGESIFTRNKPLSEKTLERIYAGLVKYVAKGDKAFISKYFSGRPKGKVNSVNDPSSTVTTFGGSTLVEVEPFLLQTYAADSKGHNTFSTEQPARTITTRDSTHLVQPEFIVQRNGGDPENKLVDINGPARTITTTGGNQELVQPQFLANYYGDGGQHASIENPSPTLTTRDRISLISPEFLTIYNGKSLNRSVDEPSPVVPCNDRLALVQPEYFIDQHYGHAQNQSIEQPAGSILTNDKHRLVKCDSFIMPTNYNNGPKSIDEPAPTITANRKHHYIVNPSHGGHSTSTEAPCPVIVARQDKAPLYLVQVEHGLVAIAIYEGDPEIMIMIKQFMALYNLVDIKMRMLRVLELLKIQGFPSNYNLFGNQADQKKFIGNSVVPHVVKAWIESMAIKIIDLNKQKVA